MPTDALLAVENVAFEIEGRTILHPLRMAVGAGRMVGVIGHNGSGKSTLGKILARQVRPSAGSLQVLGQCAEAIGARGFARLVAYLPQQIPPAVGMTVRELVAMGRYPWLGAFKSPISYARTYFPKASMAFLRITPPCSTCFRTTACCSQHRTIRRSGVRP
ncbi:hypothetical protein C1I89_14770 [Achromobacter pulmonis]|uniref:ABC transporter domain-containing protein n=1 Tax=Achromobacter pulmonis TaxID=1389932 RepID=A0A2N8KJT3_9BURK|nr:ATP-binding cassette domain-containing protein [Achromobacter pulmonis]PND33710.1 hypothetical protein C1I89_14770 [Achromobacter pulmonis]